ncbi:hypothetical protein MS3_00003582 [Schistosoma haematobium]|uniref:Uncharacterized protein n=1 Tax=Schistosoma haematobium TaxID=6185 RepID=A0A6A5DUI4_SCHHA|nr:hypothetical protein MS3_00003582 [Schistosoma haematobium]KAH9591214.1 hypothetical protein MS3_00003582 [Schistosoma haematobium]CAH8667270.1 unnamed protein product [Schistosoma haematobium]CAH8673737.1 unnamed protein product [Schistosoma haematobium]
MSGTGNSVGSSHLVSLYQTLEQKEFVGRANVLYSVVLVGKISPHITNNEVGKFYEKLTSSFTTPDHITGLLMVYPYHVIHIIESSFRSLMEVFRVIAKSEEITESYMNRHSEQINKSHYDAQDYRHFSEFDKVIIQEMYTKNSLAPTIHNRVLCAIDNIVHRIYHTYELLVFDMEPTVISDYDSNESDEKKLLDLLSQVIRLSVHLAEESMRDQDEYVPETFKRKLTGILNNIRQVRPELIPQQVAVGYFADISCYEGIIPLKEYMKLYDIPYETSSQSELTWPIERNSFIYK